MNKKVTDDMKLAVNKDLGLRPKVINLFSDYDPTNPAVKNWRVTYEVLFEGDTTPTRRVLEFHYFETACELVKRTEKHCNLIFANIEKI